MAKSLPKHQEQSDLPQQQGIHNAESYPFNGHLCLGFGHIMIIIRLTIITWYACNHMVYNILYHIQIMVHHNVRLLLVLIWSRSVHVLMLTSVRKATSQVISMHNRDGASRAYLTPKREDYKECTRNEQWSDQPKISQLSRHISGRSGGPSRLIQF